MADDLKLNASNVISGLGTFNLTCPDTGKYSVGVTSTIPQGSELSLDIQKNTVSQTLTGGSSTSPGHTASSSSDNNLSIQCTAGDVLSVVLSSSAAPDQVLNAVKSVVNINKRFNQ